MRTLNVEDDNRVQNYTNPPQKFDFQVIRKLIKE